jgi:hypothetical protein
MVLAEEASETLHVRRGYVWIEVLKELANESPASPCRVS